MKTSNLNLFLFATIICFVSNVNRLEAQDMTEESNKIWNVTLPSSNSWSFQNVTNNSYIDHFTGRPNVSIPIYKISTRELSLPISINYSSSGVVVNKKPELLGIGWTLSASGSVNRATIGLPDEDPNGYLTTGPRYILDNGRLQDFSIYNCYSASNGLLDLQPDQFQYNVSNGLSGTFFLNPANDEEVTILQVPRSDNKIFKNDGSLSGTIQWLIKDINGNNYYFGTFDNQTVIETTQSEEQSIWQKSTWHLMAIVSANESDTIRFHYEEGGIEELEYYDEVYTKVLNQNVCPTGGSFCPAEEGFTSNLRLVSHQTFLLKRIETELMFIDFNTILRGSIKSLDNIKVYLKSKPSTPLNEFKFSYLEYGALNNNNFRFFLSDLVKSTPSSEENEKFVFLYIQPEILPELNSSSIDHWGYYNGKSNAGIVQKHIILNHISINETCYEYGNANRAADTALVYTGMLKEVVFPTGGILKYNYESNSFCQIKDVVNTSIKENNRYDVNLTSRYGDTTYSFIIDEQQLVTFNYSIICEEMAGGEEPQIDIIFVEDNSTILSFNCGGPNGYQQFNHGDVCRLLGPGNYMVSVTGNSGEALISFSHKTHTLLEHPVEQYGGGCRVKNYTLTDNNDSLYAKRFKYKSINSNWPSSGILHNNPKYIFFQDYHKRVGQTCIFECSFFTISSGSIYDLQLSKGNYVNYNGIEEITTSSNTGGSKVYQFYNPVDEDDYSLTPYHFPYSPAINTDWKRGMPEKVIIKDSEGNIKSEMYYNYSLINPTYLYGIKFGQSSFTDEFNQNAMNSAYFDFTVYRYTSADYLLHRQINSDFIGGQVIQTEEAYSYTPSLAHRQIANITHISNDLERLTKIIYTKDYPSASGNTMAQALENMNQKNIISPVEVTNWVKNNGGGFKLTDGQLILYRLQNNNPVKDKLFAIDNNPNTNFTHSYINPSGSFNFDSQFWTKKIGFDNFSDLYRLKQRTVKDKGVIQSAIYGKNDNFLITQTTNASLSESGHTSFENNELNGWSKYDANSFVTIPEKVFTGKGSMSVSGYGPYQIFSVGQNAEKHSGYKASVWTKGKGAYLHIEINGVWSSHVRVKNEFEDGLWHKLDVELPRHKIQPYFSQGENLKIKVYVGSESGTVYFDDLRFHPSDAQMTTYTHEPLIGVTSISNESNKPEFYIYDPFGRLELVKDFEGNIIKKNDYHYRTDEQ